MTKISDFFNYLKTHEFSRFALFFALVSLIPYFYAIIVEDELFGNGFLAFMVTCNWSFSCLIIQRLRNLEDKLNENPTSNDEKPAS